MVISGICRYPTDTLQTLLQNVRHFEKIMKYFRKILHSCISNGKKIELANTKREMHKTHYFVSHLAAEKYFEKESVPLRRRVVWVTAAPRLWVVSRRRSPL